MEPVVEAAEAAVEATTEVVEKMGFGAGHILGGVVLGVAMGAASGFVIARRVLETKYNQLAEEEIEEMRVHYRNKMIALDSEASKSDLEEIVKERGYSVPTDEPPMAVTPPAAVVEAVEAAAEDDLSDEVIEAEPVVEEEPVVRNIFKEARQPESVWDVNEELARRSPLTPYVIHRDERPEMEAYDEVTLTYYSEDDVLCNERDEVIDPTERDKLIGEGNLEKFGHGSGDASIVYIRNDALEMQFEVVQSPNSYAEEVHGLKHSDWGPPRRKVAYDDE